MISVAMCSFNGEKYIAEQIQSVLNQTVHVDEVILCDDCSTDSTVYIAEELFKKSSISFIIKVNERNIGITKNFEQAINLCSGEIIFLADQDDVWLNNKVEQMIKELEIDQCMLAFSNAFIVDAEKQDMGYTLLETNRFKRKYTPGDFFGGNFVTGATVAFKRELLRHSIPIPQEWIHDAWLALVAVTVGEIRGVDNNLILYRQHENNAIGAKKLYKHIINRLFIKRKKLSDIIKNRFDIVKGFTVYKQRFFSFLSQTEQKELLKALSFWEISFSLNKHSFLKGLWLIFNNIVNGNYKKYSSGLYTAAADFLVVVGRGKVDNDKLAKK